MPKDRKRVVNVSVLPGEPLDGRGRVCIHLFVPDESGPFVEPHVLSLATDEQGRPISRQTTAGPVRGRLACDPRRLVAPVVRGNVVTVTARTDDPHAATCLKCLATAEYRAMLARIESRGAPAPTTSTDCEV